MCVLHYEMKNEALSLGLFPFFSDFVVMPLKILFQLL